MRSGGAAPRGGQGRDFVGDGPEPQIHQVSFAEDAMDEAALRVVRRLTKGGHEAYLVGGCVRDLLVGVRPKDFDVATSARPEEVRALLRNSRIIGRRFRLVHVLFPNNHVIETATFRKNPTESDASAEDLLIRSDNVFGNAYEDAHRRDFTINGLFYDVERGAVLDWVGGMKDVEGRVVSTIGEPVLRFREDPVRMLRAVKFAARIDFGMSPEVYGALVQCRGDLAMAARPRLSEEMLRLMRGGASHRSVWLLWETGLLDVLLPELSVHLADGTADERVFATLTAVDFETRSGGVPLDDVVLWGALLLEPLLDAVDGAHDRVKAGHEFLEPVVERLNVPRRISEAVCRIAALVPRLVSGKAGRAKRNPLYREAEHLLRLSGRTARS